MDASAHTNSDRTSRRTFLKGTALAALPSLAGDSLIHRSASGEEPMKPLPSKGTAENVCQREVLTGIDPKNVVDEYARRGLDAVSDADLYREAAAIISKPQARGINSFALHAPLELMARYGLLPYVEPRERGLARLQTVTSAAAYEAGVKTVGAPAPIQPFPDLSAAKQEFTRTFRAGDADGLDAIVLQIASQFGTASLAHLLTPLALPTLTGASHSHIGLWLLLRHGQPSETSDAALLRAAVRRIAAEPNLQLGSFSGLAISGTKPLMQNPLEIEREILLKLANPTKGARTSASLRPLLQAGERTGNPDALFGEFIRHDLTPEQIGAAFRGVLRVCAYSMLQDDLSEAKFGWSHCLTLPQAAFGLSTFNMDSKLALAATLVWITAYRSVLSRRALDFGRTPAKIRESISVAEALRTSPAVAADRVWHAEAAEVPLIMRKLATEASIRNDQHLVKYTRACFDMGAFDPLYKQLYLAAAAHLCALWIQESPREKIEDNLLKGRILEP